MSTLKWEIFETPVQDGSCPSNIMNNEGRIMRKYPFELVQCLGFLYIVQVLN
jgi:hypothetical protein